MECLKFPILMNINPRMIHRCVLLFPPGWLGLSVAQGVAQTNRLPRPVPGGFDLPNGWRITPAGKAIVATEDMVLKMTAAPDGRVVIATHAGYNPHGLVVIDTRTHQAVQRIGLKSTWLGLAWSPDGKTLYASGGNANGSKVKPTLAPVYEFSYANGRLSPAPTGQLD